MTWPAIYARVSTSDQSVEQQLSRLRVASPGALEFVDLAASGRSEDRPSFLKLKAQIETGEISSVHAVKLDRLGRSAQSLLAFFELCGDRAVRVVVLDQAIDTSTSAGRLVRTVLAAVAEFESDLIRDRTRDALGAIHSGARATRSGRPVGRPPRLTRELLEQIRQLREVDGLRWSQVALRLHVPASSARKWYANARRGAATPPAKTPRVIKRV